MSETTFVLVKIPVTDQRCRMATVMIERDLKKSGLRLGILDVSLKEDELLSLYGHLPEAILISVLARFANVRLPLFMVQGDGAVKLVSEMKGLETFPLKCAEGTWRRRLVDLFGDRQVNLLRPSGEPIVTVVDNFVHAPSLEEVEVHRRTLARFFEFV